MTRSHPSHIPHSSDAHSAFTLIEILVALVIMAIVAGCAYGLYMAATTSVARYRAREQVERDARTLLRMMGREIRCSYFPAQESAPTVQPTPAGTGGSMTALAPAPLAPAAGTESTTRSDRPIQDYLSGPGGRDDSFLETLTSGGIADPDRPSSGWYNVDYRLDAGRKMIWRRQVDLLEPPDSKAQETSWVCVARGVESVKCSFFDGKEWKESWKTDLTTGLPYAVRIEMALTDSEGRAAQYATTINVPLATGAQAQSQTQAPAVAPRPLH